MFTLCLAGPVALDQVLFYFSEIDTAYDLLNQLNHNTEELPEEFVDTIEDKLEDSLIVLRNKSIELNIELFEENASYGEEATAQLYKLIEIFFIDTCLECTRISKLRVKHGKRFRFGIEPFPEDFPSIS